MYVLLPPDCLLPPACPACGAQGMHPRPVSRPLGAPTGPPFTAHYCDLCSERLGRRTTAAYGLLAASVLFELGLVTALTLSLGAHAVVPQALWATGFAAFLGGLWLLVGVPPVDQVGLIDERETPEGRIFFATNSRFVQEMLSQVPGARKAEGARVSDQRFGTWGSFHLLAALPLILGIVWLLSLQSWGGAKLRVVHSGPSPLVLLVDGRRMASVLGTRFEDPKAGKFVRLLGGRRELTLLKSDGTELARRMTTIWPGRTYVVGKLPEDRCLFMETRRYGALGNEHFLEPIEDTEPVWELKSRIDSWFQPLPSEADLSPESSPWRGSGGKRTALRLLSCRNVR